MKGFALSLAIIFGVVWILATFNSCGRSASAHPFGEGEGDWMARKKVEFVKYVISTELELTDDQKGELDRITSDLESRHDAMHATAVDFKKELLEELSKDQISADDLMAVFKSHEPAMNDMLNVLAEKMHEFHVMLAPDQRAGLIAHLESKAGGGCPFRRRFSGADKTWVKEKKLDMVKYMISSELDLTDDQQAELDRILDDLGSRHDTIRSQHQNFKTGLIDTLAREEASAEDIKKQFEAHKPAMESMVDALTENLAQFHTMLTPDQRAKLTAALASHAGGGCRFSRHW
jgi:Spy/CpxP family protein refolding chaperone